MQITSKSYNDKYSFLINKEDLVEGEIRFDSFVKYSKIFTGNHSIILRTIGKLKETKFENIISLIIEMIKG